MAVTAPVKPVRSAATRPLLSIVLPAHNEGGVVDNTLARIAALGAELGDDIEVIVVSDGSSDATFEDACGGLRRGLAGRVIELATNVGSHAAILCGLRYARGDLAAIMAADGQDPPEALPAMLARFTPEIDVVWGRRRTRRSDRVGARLAAAAFYRAFRMLSRLDFPPSGLDFVVVRRRVVESVLRSSTRNTSLFLLIYNLGFRQAFVEYDRGARVAGRSSWSLPKRFKLAVDMLTGCSAAPIRMASLAGIVVGVAGILVGGVTLVRAAFGHVPVSGWASLMVVSSFMGGLMLVAIAFLGEYVWRILDEVRGAPPLVEARHEDATGETVAAEVVERA